MIFSPKHKKLLKKTVATISLWSLLLTLSGCATIFGSNTRSVRVDSQPPGAAIYVDNQQCGVTPAVVTLPNYVYGGKVITLKKDGYETQSNPIVTRFQPVTLINILFWPGFLIDAATGTFVKIDENSFAFNTTLQKVEAPIIK